MAKAPDPKLIEVLRKYEEDPREAMWDCHGTWVVYHKAIERIAAKAGVTFDMPEIVEARSADRIVSIVVRGFMGDRAEWSFGEAAPGNNKNSYPYAMAEKRAKDRVVLKLVGLHGLAYSEEEADDFKPDSAGGEQKKVVGFRADGTRTAHSLKKDGVWDEFQAELLECHIPSHVTKLALAWSKKAEDDKWPSNWREQVREELEKRMAYVKSSAPDDDIFPGDRPNGIISTLQAG